MVTVTPAQLATLLTFTIPAHEPVLIVSAPGVGKTAISGQASFKAGAEFMVAHPVVDSPIDYKGIPFVFQNGTAEFIPYGFLRAMMDAKKLTVVLLDDLGQSPPAVQAACFPAGTMVATPCGTMPIELIQVGNQVVDSNGVVQTVTQVFSRYSNEMLQINAVGLLPLKLTPEHPVLVCRGGRKRSYYKHKNGSYLVNKETVGKIEWSLAKDIKPGDYVATPVPHSNIDAECLTIERKGQITRTVDLTEELAEIIGNYVGNGYYVQHKAVQSVSFSMGDKYPERQTRLRELIEKVFGAKIFVKQCKGCKVIAFHDPALGVFLSEHCGHRANNKKIPQFILFNKNRNILTAFLRGYLATDGALMRNKNVIRGIQWSTVSRTLALQLQLASTRYSTLATIKLHCKQGMTMTSPHNGKKYHVQDSYTIQCSDANLLDAIGTEYDAKRKVVWSFKHDDKIWTRVKSIQTASSDEVYNLEVSGSHTYLAENFAVHNCMQLLLERSINGKRISDNIVFIACTNRKQDKAGVNGILEPVKSRFCTIVELVADLNSWIKWYLGTSLPVTVASFIRFRPDYLHDFKATSDMTNSPCPRTLEKLARLVQMNLPSDLRYAAYAGAVGKACATEYLAFEAMADKMVDPSVIIMRPAESAIPESPDGLYATCLGVAAQANENNIDAIDVYARRLPADFRAMLMDDIISKDEKLVRTRVFQEFFCENHQKLM
jgi:hypothetical protein